TNRPAGRIDTMCGVRLLTASKSSRVSSTSASAAIASKCSTALVDPAVAITTAAAFRTAALVSTSRGRSPLARAATAAAPVRRASSVRSADTAGGVAEPGSAMPSASAQADMVLAVYMPAHDPAPGQAARSMARASASDISPAAWAPTASNTSWMVTERPFAQPGRTGPRGRNAAGMFSRAQAMSMPGSDLSQPAMATRASKPSAATISSTESAITSRLTSDAFMPSVPIEMPSDTAMVPNSSGTAPACLMPSLAATASPFRCRLQGVTSFHDEATATCGRVRSSSLSPTARSMARAAARAGPVVSGPERGRGSWLVIPSPKASGPAGCRRAGRESLVRSRGDRRLSAGPQQAEGDAVGQRLPGCRDDVLGHADGGPLPRVVSGGEHHPGDRARRCPAIQDADLVVDEMDVLQLRIEIGQAAAQRLVQGVHRADPLADGDDALAAEP